MPETDYSLKIEGVPGEAGDKALPGAMDLLSWSWGTVQGAGAGANGGGAGRVRFDVLHFSMTQNKASAILFSASASGQHFTKATMVGVRDGNEFLRADMVDILVGAVQSNGGSSLGPIDTVSINFADMQIHYSDAQSRTFKGSQPMPSYALKR